LTLQSVTFSNASVGSLIGDADLTAAGYSFTNVLAGSYVVKASGTLSGSADLTGLAVLGSSYVLSPVPEPGAYAMMLAGMGVVGFVAVRRRRML